MSKIKFSLIAIHGNGGGGFRFERIKPFIPPTVKFLMPTLPGFAEEPKNNDLKTLKDYASQLCKNIEGAPRPLILLGTGIGGSIAIEFLQRFESDVQGLILHAPVGTRLDTRFFPKLMKPVWVRRLGQEIFASKLARPLFKSMLFENPQQIPTDYLNHFFEAYRRSEAFSQMFDIINDNWFKSLRPANTPTVLLWGEKERVLTPDQAQDYQLILPNSSIKLIPNWNHFPMIEQPEHFAEEILSISSSLLNPI